MSEETLTLQPGYEFVEGSQRLAVNKAEGKASAAITFDRAQVWYNVDLVTGLLYVGDMAHIRGNPAFETPSKVVNLGDLNLMRCALGIEPTDQQSLDEVQSRLTSYEP